MECTAEEIAEKRRIALERLKAKKEALAKARQSSIQSNGTESTTLATSKKIPTNPYQNSRILSHPYANKTPSTSSVNVKKEPTVSIPTKVISCTCYMITDNRFEVQPSAFSTPLINIFRTIPSRGYGRKEDRPGHPIISTL